MKLHLLAAFLVPATLSAAPQWIWTSANARPDEKATFRKSFSAPGAVKSARLTVVCDNGAKAVLNGHEVLENPDWQVTSREGVGNALKPGANELVIHARNQGGAAALLVLLEIEAADGSRSAVESGEGWEVAAVATDPWKPATVVAKHGQAPWGDVLGRPAGAKARRSNDAPEIATDAKDISVPPGFKVERLYTVPKAEQGSWVSMTVDNKGRLICGDQYGALYRLTPPPVGSGDQAKIEKLEANIGGAHGILYAHDSLYFMLNERSAPQAAGKVPGLYRLRDTDGNGRFGEPILLSECQGGGEHGPHSPVLGPDGKSIFFNSGNHTRLPANLTSSRAPMDSWAEDHILPRMWDSKGHARGILAPGGYVCRTDPDGGKVEFFGGGFRNEFDFAFDANGEMLTYDADMEWDLGTPWYRPTRIYHVVSGGDYGWRSASGKWPSHYEDSLPHGVDIGPGSPTGVVFGTGAKFPAKYQRALFGNDWTYGTMYAVHCAPEGASFRMVREEFLSAKPLPLTDVVIHPHDGAMYFATGGRRTQSAVYRVTFEGSESTAPAPAYAITPEMKQRRELEKLHLEGVGPGAIDKAWPWLGNRDRFLRYAARIAVERQPVSLWRDRALKEKDPQARIEALIALARMTRTADRSPGIVDGKPMAGASSGPVPAATPEGLRLQAPILDALGEIQFAALDPGLQLQLVRAYQLAFTRHGKPGPETCAAVAARLDRHYPSRDPLLNRELCQLLVFLDSRTAAAKTLALMATAEDDSATVASDALLARNTGYARAAEDVHQSRPNRQQIAFMFALRNCTAGWTPELRQTYFSWFPRARSWKGGNSFSGFIENTRQEALKRFAPPEEYTRLDQLSSRIESVVAANITPPQGPGRAYTTDEIVKLAQGNLRGRDFARGKNLYSAIMCAACHHFAGDGGNIGPDLTGSGNRYTLRDLVENLTEPSKVISDQYGSHQIEKKDGGIIVGRIISEDADKVMIMTNPFAPNVLAPIAAKEIKARKDHPVSMMPPGLINALNQDELRDLLAYLLSGGNAGDKMFAK